jgi:hypothetical protein
MALHFANLSITFYKRGFGYADTTGDLRENLCLNLTFKIYPETHKFLVLQLFILSQTKRDNIKKS